MYTSGCALINDVDRIVQCISVHTITLEHECNLRYAYDAPGNVTTMRDYLNSNQEQNFGYDALNRLTSASTNRVGSGQYSHSYVYNKIGNITNFAGTAYAYNGGKPHAITHLGGVQRFWYDANGNMTKRIEGDVTYDPQVYDVQNQLVSVTKVGTGVTTFAYDAAGIRVKTVHPGGKTSYFPFPGYEEEVNGSTITRRVAYAIAGQTVALRVQVVGTGGSNTLYYLHSDHLGSTSLATTTAGAVVSGSTARYLPFGGWRTTPTAVLTDIGFTGHRHNNVGAGAEDVGLIYMNARWYAPYLNRTVALIRLPDQKTASSPAPFYATLPP